jgi:4-hydroxybenzoate polyprenyltransferase
MMSMTQPSRREILHGYLVLPHAVPIVVVMVATATFALIAAGGWPGTGTIVRLLGAMLGAQLAIGAMNEIVDADLDAIAKPDKPIPAGLVSRRGAGIVVVVGIVLMSALSLGFGVGSFLLCALGTGAGIAYSVWFKRTIWSWIPYLVALPLLPIWVWATLDTVRTGILAVYPIGVAAVVAVQIAQSFPDIEADRRTGVRTLAVALGATRARRVCWGAMILAVVLAVCLAPWLTDRPSLVWIAAPVPLALVALNSIVWRRHPQRGVMALFPCIAVGTAVLGAGWTAALVNV